MPTLSELKNKWFINTSDAESFPPKTRHAGSVVSVSTDGNLVTPLIDGEAFMGRWYDSIQAMISGSNPSACEVWHTGWRLEGVETKGHSIPISNALDVFNAAEDAGVKIYGMISAHVIGIPINHPSMLWLQAHNLTNMVYDARYPAVGSMHQKFCCMRNPVDPHCLIGSIDISKTRWDRPTHSHVDPERNPSYGKPTHDTGVAVRGPAVADLEASFKERWNDTSRLLGLGFGNPPFLPPLITSSISSPPPVSGGTHSVQVLHTYGRTRNPIGYNWSTEGEFTVWASYLNAIKNARNYIYIEDQYFLPFNWPLCCKKVEEGLDRDTDLFYQLGRAILEHGVKVLAVMPSNAEDSMHMYQKFQRDSGIEYLNTIRDVAISGDFVVASLTNGASPVYVHSKLMIVDDEFVSIGSANIAQRSQTYDSELQLGIVDSANLFAKNFRKSLWAEHLGASQQAVDDPLAGFALFKAAVNGSTPTGHVERYPFEAPDDAPAGHGTAIKHIIDPYGGPMEDQLR